MSVESKSHQKLSFAFAATLLVAGANVEGAENPNNIVQNWSFEFIYASQAVPWTGYYGIGGGRAADGATYIQPIGFASQTLTTIPGQNYEVSFAVSGNGGRSIIDLSWNGRVVGNVATSDYVLYGEWMYGTFDVTATTDSTVLRFDTDALATEECYLDAVQVVPIPEPSATCIFFTGLVFVAQVCGLRRLRACILQPNGPGADP